MSVESVLRGVRVPPIAEVDELVDIHRKIDRKIDEYVRGEMSLRVNDNYPIALFDTIADYVQRPSKHFVGLLYLMTLRALAPDHDITAEPLLNVALALELRHAAILIQDDIVDGDRVRGSISTAPATLESCYGPEADHAALFAGEALSAMSVSPVTRSGLAPAIALALVDVMMRGTCQTAIGQALQLH